jgi:hypothetical protein
MRVGGRGGGGGVVSKQEDSKKERALSRISYSDANGMCNFMLVGVKIFAVDSQLIPYFDFLLYL